MAFRRVGAILGICIAALGLAVPQYSHASWLSALGRFFSDRSFAIEEGLPSLLPFSQAAALTSALNAQSRPPLADGDDEAKDSVLTVLQDNALLAPLNPVGTISDEVPPAGHIFIYTIRPGDTIQGIAKSFDVSVNTILWANSISDFRALKVGGELVILPVSGVKHEVKKGDTIQGIAQRYRASITDLAQFNGLAPDAELALGSTIIVPDGELPQAAPLASGGASVKTFANLPSSEGYYLRPILGGRRSRGLHGYNGVDLASSCGQPVLAAADGEVLVSRSSGWNGGYGRYVAVTHPNGTQTLYAHLRELSISVGQSVRQGAVIGTIGSSGNSTGCHVHVEVRGARNPF